MTKLTYFHHKLARGFTLIEMLVVISIIGILAAIAITSYSSAQKQARDRERMSDLNQFRIALENYATNNSSTYPYKTGNANSICMGPVNLSPTYIASCPTDPRQSDDPSYIYYYNASMPLPSTTYNLAAKLENGTSTYWYICGNGKSCSNATPPDSAYNCPCP